MCTTHTIFHCHIDKTLIIFILLFSSSLRSLLNHIQICIHTIYKYIYFFNIIKLSLPFKRFSSYTNPLPFISYLYMYIYMYVHIVIIITTNTRLLSKIITKRPKNETLYSRLLISPR